MINNKFGKIINISTSSQTMIRKGYSPYGPSKAFIEATSRTWAYDLEGTGVDVNVKSFFLSAAIQYTQFE